MRPGHLVALALGACSVPDSGGVGGGGDGGTVDGGAGIDGMPADAGPALTWLIDGRSAFAATGAGGTTSSLENLRVGVHGVLEPIAWAVGGLDTRGSDERLFTEATDDVWAAVTAATPSGRAIAALTAINFGAGAPTGLGITDGDDWTMWADGEVYLEAGAHTFNLRANHAGYLAIADGDGAFFELRATGGGGGAVVTGQLTIPTAGWRRIRTALAEQAGSARYLVTHALGTGQARPLSPWQLRAPVGDTAGVVRTAFDAENYVARRGTTLWQAPLILDDSGGGRPADLGLFDDDYWTERLAGQVWIEFAGDYTFALSTDDGYRLRLDGVEVAAAWDFLAHVDTSAPVTLDRGWHDLVLEHQEAAGLARLELRVASAPEAELVGQPLPLARLRPVSSRRERLAAAEYIAPANAGEGDYKVGLDAPADATLVEAAIGYLATHPAWSQLRVTAEAPWSAVPIVLRDGVAGTGTLLPTHLLTPAELPGTPALVDGSWGLGLEDTSGGDDTTFYGFAVTARFAGGPAAHAGRGSWRSAVHDFGRPVAIDDVTWVARLGATDELVVRVRGCASEACDEPFVDVAELTTPLPPARFAQVEVGLLAPGDDVPHLDRLIVHAR
ncbi:MAG: hypothetical protein R2939_03665 [Kofleriaceae bacterium]